MEETEGADQKDRAAPAKHQSYIARKFCRGQRYGATAPEASNSSGNRPHQPDHAAIGSCVSNPKESWNYRDESEIGTCACQAKHTNQVATETALIPRYRVTFQFEGSTP